MKENEKKEYDVNEEILNLKRINNWNSAIIIALLAILLFVCIVMVYVKFFSWLIEQNKLK